MHSRDLVSLNFKIIESNAAFVSAGSSGVLYGQGVFTTIAIRNATPFPWEEHWIRLRRDASTVGIDHSQISEEDLYDSLTKLIEANGLEAGRARITWIESDTPQIWKQLNVTRGPDVLIQTADVYPAGSDLKLGFSPYSIDQQSPFSGTKSCNYLERLFAYMEAERSGFREVIRSDRADQVTGACMANLFWL